MISSFIFHKHKHISTKNSCAYDIKTYVRQLTQFLLMKLYTNLSILIIKKLFILNNSHTNYTILNIYIYIYIYIYI